MKLKHYILILAASFLFSEGVGQVVFQRTFGGIGDEGGNFVSQTSDGGYIVSGGVSAFLGGEQDAYLIKLDSNGDTLWTKRYGGTGYDTGRSVQQCTDGGYVFTGQTLSFGGGGDAWIVKTDVNGNISMAKSYNINNESDAGHSIRQTNDGGYIVTGSTTYSFQGEDNIYNIKTDAGGNISWTKTYGKNNFDDLAFGFAVEQTIDGGYIILGWGYNIMNASSITYLIKAYPNGVTQWIQIYDDVFPTSVQQTLDGGYIIIGSLLIKTDVNGDTLWSKTLSMGNNFVEGYSVQQTTDGGYIIAGADYDLGFGDWDAYLIKTDSLGNTLWSKVYGGTGEDYIYSVRQTSDGGYIAAGSTNSFGAGGFDFYIIKTDSLGNSGCNEMATNFIAGNASFTISSGVFESSGGVQNNISPTVNNLLYEVNDPCDNTISINQLPITNNQSTITIHPNPFTTSATVEISNVEQGMSNVEFALYDQLGRELQRFEVQHSVFEIQRDGLPAGIYFYSIMGTPSPPERGGERYLGRGKLVIY